MKLSIIKRFLGLLLLSSLVLFIYCSDDTVSSSNNSNPEVDDIYPYMMAQVYGDSIFGGSLRLYSELKSNTINNMGDTLFGVVLIAHYNNDTTDVMDLYTSIVKFNGGDPNDPANWELESAGKLRQCTYQNACGG